MFQRGGDQQNRMSLLKRTVGFSDMRVVADLNEGSSGGTMVGWDAGLEGAEELVGGGKQPAL